MTEAPSTDFYLAIRRMDGRNLVCSCVGPFPSVKRAEDEFTAVYGASTDPTMGSVMTRALTPEEVRTLDPMTAVSGVLNAAAERLLAQR